jgi:hypothetical protein
MINGKKLISTKVSVAAEEVVKTDVVITGFV